MLIYPAIDLISGEAVRLFKGDYNEKTVYSNDPVGVAMDFKAQGAERVHIVDLEGAKSGIAGSSGLKSSPNFDAICRIKEQSGLFCEVGGGIRSIDIVEKYISIGIDRVIIGTAAVTDPDFVRRAVGEYGDKIAVGIDALRDGESGGIDRRHTGTVGSEGTAGSEGRFLSLMTVRIKGWTQGGGVSLPALCASMEDIGVRTLICTDISRDGAMAGANIEMYRELQKRCSMDIIASGGVSSLDDVRKLAALGLHGAIIGKAYYTGAVSIKDAVAAGLKSAGSGANGAIK